jgi:arginase|tara:strand:- start:327 stop:1118 length:792 start_codon:yes stop_codon:yes gene_type:complete
MNNILYVPFFKGQSIKNGKRNYEIIKKLIPNNYNLKTYNKFKKDNTAYTDLMYFFKYLNYNNYNKIIGGDHSTSISTLQHSVLKNRNLKVLWFDAHPDINTYEMSNTKNIHGIPLAVATGLENKFSFTNIKLPYKSIMYIGIRSIDDFENQIIKDNNIQYLTVENIMKSPKESIEKIQDFIKDSNVHMSFDVDCMDPSIMTTTGTPVENGLFMEDIKQLINPIKKHIIFTECHEFNIKDNFIYDNKTITKSIDSLNSVFKIIF